MCQAYEGERRAVVSAELREIREKWARHESGEAPLSDEEIQRLAVEELMLMEN